MFSLFLLSIRSEQPVNYALKFNGEGILSLGRFTDLDNLKQFSFQFWVCPSDWIENSHIIQKGNSFSISLGSLHQLIFSINDRNFTITSPELDANRWSHITIINGDGLIQFLVNNKLIHQEQNTISFPVSEEPVYLGVNYKGRIDELRIYNKILKNEYDYFWQNTISELNAQWGDLIGYYKFDQFTCKNVVDYKGKNHGTMSRSGVSREKVTDNDKFAYLMAISYINFRRFGWARLDEAKLTALNHLIFLAGHTDPQANAWVDPRVNNASFENVDYVEKFEDRNGISHFNGKGSKMNCGKYTIPNGVFTFGAWIYIEEWIENSILIKKYLNEKLGFTVKLSNKNDKSLVLHINDHDFILKNKLQEKKWIFFSFSTNSSAESMLKQVFFVVDDWSGYADEGPSGESSQNLTDFDGLSEIETIVGEDFKGYIDDLILFQMSMTKENITEYIKPGYPSPEFGKYIPRLFMLNVDAYYKFNGKDELGISSVSWKEIMKKIIKPYENRRNHNIMLSFTQHTNWLQTIRNEELREKLAANIAKCVNDDDIWMGVDLDFEYPLTSEDWFYHGEFIKSLKLKLKENKLLTFAPHGYNHALHKEHVQYVDYAFIQCYDNKFPEIYTNEVYNKIYENVTKIYPPEKIALSFGATTTWGFINGKHEPTYPFEGVYQNLYSDNFTRDTSWTTKDGYDYNFTSFNDVYYRAKFMREKKGAGLFYWDTISDINTNKYVSLAKAMSFGISGNCDIIVDKVENPPPTPFTPHDKMMLIIIISASVLSAVLIITIIVIACCCCRSKKKDDVIASMNTLLDK